MTILQPMLRKRNPGSVAIFVCVSSFMLVAPVLAGSGVWTTAGPHGGSVRAVVADPLVADRLLAAGRGGVFRSNDGGTSWTRFESGALIQYAADLVVAEGSSRYYLLTGIGELYRGDGAGPWTDTGPIGTVAGFYSGLAVDPGDPDHVAVAGFYGTWFSVDGGNSWSAPATGLPSPTDSSHPVAIAISGNHAYLAWQEVPAGAASPVFRSSDGGVTWSEAGALSGGTFLGGDIGLIVSPTNSAHVTLHSRFGIFRSVDGGSSWTAVALPASGDNGSLLTLTVDPANPDALFGGFERGFQYFDGVGWTPLDSGLSNDAIRTNRIESIALAPGYPADDRIWVASDPSGLWRSFDGGISWATAQSGIEAANVRSLAINPLQPDRMWAGYGDGFGSVPALYRSIDGALSWNPSNAGTAAVSIRALAVDQTTTAVAGGEHLYAVGTSYGFGDPLDGSGPLDSGIYKSTDGGGNWNVLEIGLPETIPGHRYIGLQRSVALDPRSCASPPVSGPCASGPLQTLYVGGSGWLNDATGTYAAARIHKSNDGGATWFGSDSGLPTTAFGSGACRIRQAVIPLLLDPSAPQVLYVGTFLSQYDASCPTPTLENGVFRSTDGGASWTHSSSGLPRRPGAGSSHYDVLALAIDPVSTSTVYAAVAQDLQDPRIFKSTDSGANWNEISVGIAGQDVRALLVDPSDPQVVYAGSGGSVVDPGGVYRSDDGGLTWNSISIGLPASSATALALDPSDPSRLLAGTAASVWELTRLPDPDVDGVPSSTEAAAPNDGDGNGNGIADAAEPDVASLQGASGAPAGSAAAVPAGAALSRVTLALRPIEGNCLRINNAHALDAQTLPNDDDRGVAASTFGSWGVLRFELPDCVEAEVDVIVHGAYFSDSDWTWRNFGPAIPGDATTLGWYGFAGATRIAADTWRLRIRAGETGSYRDDGSNILFVGAPGFVDLQVFGSGFED